jgi:hypothetical protein
LASAWAFIVTHWIAITIVIVGFVFLYLAMTWFTSDEAEKKSREEECRLRWQRAIELGKKSKDYLFPTIQDWDKWQKKMHDLYVLCKRGYKVAFPPETERS